MSENMNAMSAAPGCPEPAIVPTQHLWVGPALVAVALATLLL